MTRSRLATLAITVLAAVGCTAVGVLAQQRDTSSRRAVAAPEARTPQVPTVAELGAELAALEADPTLDDARKAALRATYEQAIEAAAAAAKFSAEAQRYRDLIQTGPDQLTRLRAQLEDAGQPDGTLSPDPSRSTEDLRRDLDARRTRLAVLGEQLTDIVGEINRSEARPLEVTARIPEAERDLLALQQQLASSDPADDSGDTSRRSELRLLQAREGQLAFELEMLQAEQQSAPIRRDLLKARRALLERETASLESAVEELAGELNLRLESTAERVRAVTSRVPPKLQADNPAVRALVEEIRVRADELERTATASRTAARAEKEIRDALQDLVTELASIREQLQLGGGGRAMVQVLFSLDSRCAKARKDLRALPVPPLGQTRLTALRVREELERRREVEAPGGASGTEPRQVLARSLLEVLEELDQQYTALVRSLAALEVARQQYLDQADEVRSYIAEQLFGFGLRAAPVIGLETFLGLPRAVEWTFQPDHWRRLARAARHGAVSHPLASALVFLLVLLLLSRRARMRAALEATGVPLRRTSTDRYAHTAEALAWTVLLALPLPLLAAFLGWTLGRAPDANDWMQGLSWGLQAAAGILLATTFITEALRPGGLGSAHFRWRREALDPLRRAVVRGAAVYLPAFVVTLSCSYGDASEHFGSLGRVSFIAAHLWLARIAYGLLYSPRRVPLPAGQETPGRLARWRPAWSALLLAAPLALVVLAALGDLITSIMLSLGLLATLGLIGGGTLAYALVLRWLRMRHRKLALAEALSRRRARREEPPADDRGTAPTELVETAREDEPRLDLDVVADQTRGLLRALFGLGTLLAILGYWSHSFPLVEIAGSFTLPGLGGLTALQLAVSVLAVVVTLTLVRNLPGLLELAVLRSTSIFPGTRHAITTLCQYAVTAVGAAVALGALQVDWAKFGWIAAALSVGLGFGLQEVVANFVCGLILLFERPLRVGDIVTVEGMTGTVTKIRMRATTIMNWDRQEFVVPNKNLITSTLLNWTLSAPLNRIVIPIGVAYGSDTDRARRILLEVAADHPEILEEPAPMATFEQFGDSSLNIILRAFLPDMDSRLATITDLHTEIDRRFREAGIGIAFPQLDLHVRTRQDATASQP